MIYLILFLISSIFTFIFWKLGRKYKIYDEANDDFLKIHKESVSCLGGLAIISTITLALLFNYNEQNIFIIIAGWLIFLLGFKDDLKWRDKVKIKKIYKFLLLVLVSFVSALLIFSTGLSIRFIPGLELILTFSCIFILINAVNYQDGMDGMAGGTIIISLIGFAFLGSGLIIPLALIAVILGFLVFNFPPAKIFMGDSGAYFLGFIVSVLTMLNLKPYDFSGAIGLVFILGLPLFDGIFTNIRRLASGKSIFVGDRNHFFDRIHKKGFSVRKTLLISYFVQAVLVIIGLIIYEYSII